MTDTPQPQGLIAPWTDRIRAFVRKKSGYALAFSDLLFLILPYAAYRLGAFNGHLFVYRLGGDGKPSALLWGFNWYVVLVIGVVVYLAFEAHYSRRKIIWEEMRDIARVLSVVAVIDLALLCLSNRWIGTRVFVLHWVVVGFGMTFGRIALVHLMSKFGLWQHPTVIIGCGENAYQTWMALRDNIHLGHTIRWILCPRGALVYSRLASDLAKWGVSVVEMAEDIDEQICSLGNPYVVVALDGSVEGEMDNIIDTLRRHANDMDIVPPLRGIPLYGMDTQYVFGSEVLLLHARNNLARPTSRLSKRVIDILLSLTLITILSPLFAWIMWKIYRQSGAPVFFGQRRVGRHGKIFTCYKFRTMVPNADAVLAGILAQDAEASAGWQKNFKLRDDPRITPVGKILRRMSLDELPQLFNVLKGDMSLVGPRPLIEGERPIVKSEVAQYGPAIRYYYDVRPGITGLWQVSGRNDTGFQRRVYLDTWYVKNWSLWYDTMILILTVKIVLRREGAY